MQIFQDKITVAKYKRCNHSFFSLPVFFTLDEVPTPLPHIRLLRLTERRHVRVLSLSTVSRDVPFVIPHIPSVLSTTFLHPRILRILVLWVSKPRETQARFRDSLATSTSLLECISIALYTRTLFDAAQGNQLRY